MEEGAGKEIFVSYRRGDSAGAAGRIFDRLQDAFGRDAVFMDVDGVDPGLDFIEVLNDTLAVCKVQIVVMGPRWLQSSDSQGRRRLDDPNDFVRLEIGHALSRGIRVIPVLVDGADPPATQDLPDELQPLSRRQAVTLTHERFAQDVQLLIGGLERALRVTKAKGSAQAPAQARPAGGDLATRVLDVLRQFNSYSEFHVDPQVPETMAARARKKARVPDSTKVLGLFDMTVFHNGTDSLIFGDDKIYHHNMGDMAVLDYSDLENHQIDMTGLSDLQVSGRKICCSGVDRKKVRAILEALRDQL